MATAGWMALLMLLVSLALFQIRPTLSTRPIQDGVSDTSALLRSYGSTLGIFSEEQPYNTTIATRLKRFRRDTAGLSPEELFLRGLQSSTNRASFLASRHKGSSSILDARSGIFLEEYGHAMEVQFGTPPQGSSLLLVDTGSSLTWTQCSPCPGCTPQREPLFNPSASTSYKGVSCTDNMCNILEKGDPITSGSCANTCQYGVTYGDGSSSYGEFALDRMTLAGGGNIVPNTYFGCGHKDFGIDGYDGILGLDSSALSMAGQLGRFSFCLLPLFPKWATQSSPIVFGDPSFPADSPNPFSTKIFSNPITKVPYYYVEVGGVTVNTEFINIPGNAFSIETNGDGGIILDSGTSFSVLRADIFDALVAQMMVTNPTNIKVGDVPCWNSASTDINKLPSITFVMGGVPLTNMGINTLGTYQVIGDNTCLAIARSTDPNTLQIIGNYQMQNMFLLFDPAAGVVQWNDYDCTKLAS